MDKKSKMMFVILGILITSSVVATYTKTVIFHDFDIIEPEYSEEELDSEGEAAESEENFSSEPEIESEAEIQI